MVLSFAVALILSTVLTPLARRLGQRFARREAHHIHSRVLPRSGGLAISLSTVAALALLLLLPVPRPAGETVRIGLLIVGSLLAFGLTLWDDVHRLAPGVKLLIQVLVAVVAIGPFFLAPDGQPPPGFVITQVQNPLGGTWHLPLLVAIPFTLLWILGMVNTVNWLDGLDGLAGGVTAIAALLLFIHTFRLEQYSLAPLPLALVGGCLGFLLYNFYPSRVIMGDSGATFLGYSLAILSIIGGAKIATALLVLGIPILDVAWVIIFRLSRGRAASQADQTHLHHRLLGLGLSQVQIVVLFYVFCGGFGALALLLPTGLYKLYILLGMALLLSVLLWWLARRQLDSAGDVDEPAP
jgi:UDP-N-acetylmuramyl pentapeptide phosphotransferase/UDP-N-acetylglucosamine-1-phosphate transferase